jgi:hypothetical protein
VSFSFYVSLAAPPSLARLLAIAPGASCDDAPEDHAETAPLPAGYACHLYRHGESARGVEVAYENGQLGVRIMTCSSRADYELGVALARGFGDATVAAEDDGEIESYDDAWIDRMVAWGPDAVMRMAESGCEMSGARRRFHVGPRLIAELRASGAADTLGARLLERFVRVQYVDEEGYYAASTFEVTPRDGRPPYTLAAWAPEVRYVFPAVERLGLVAEDGAVEIAHARGAELAGERWTWLDDKQALVEPIPDDEWEQLLRRARAS